MTVRTRSAGEVSGEYILPRLAILLYILLLLFMAPLSHAQTPILQPKPQFKAGVPIKQGSFTLVIHEGCEKLSTKIGEQCILLADGMLTVGSTDRAISHAVIDVFYYTWIDGITGKILLHQELVCPVLVRLPLTACNRNLNVPASAIVMIKIKGSAEVESVEIGKP